MNSNDSKVLFVEGPTQMNSNLWKLSARPWNEQKDNVVSRLFRAQNLSRDCCETQKLNQANCICNEIFCSSDNPVGRRITTNFKMCNASHVCYAYLISLLVHDNQRQHDMSSRLLPHRLTTACQEREAQIALQTSRNSRPRRIETKIPKATQQTLFMIQPMIQRCLRNQIDW